MGTRWTAERDQKLFLLLVEQIKVDGNALASAWKAKYNDTGVEDYQPTARAITEHIDALKKSAGGGTSTPKAKGTPRPSATPKATPRKLPVFKTPTSSAKRKHAFNFSDDEEDPVDGEDDSEAERKRLKTTPSAPRSTYSRRSKSVAKSYANNDNADDEEDADAGEDGHAAVRAPSSGLLNVQDDYFVGTAFDGAEETIQLHQRVSKMDVASSVTDDGNDNLTPQGKAATRRVLKREIREDDSDISEFTPDF